MYDKHFDSTYAAADATACALCFLSQSLLLFFIRVRGGVVPYSSKRAASKSSGCAEAKSSSTVALR